jgi:hypothetical protein
VAVNDAVTVNSTDMAVRDDDGDGDPELQVTFTPVITVDGYAPMCLHGLALVPGDDTLSIDSVPFAASALLKVLASEPVSGISGCVNQMGDFAVLDSVRVRVYSDQLYLFATDTVWSDTAGLYNVALDSGTYFLAFDKPGYRDTNRDSVQVAVKDTTKMCMVMEQRSSCCEGTTGNIDGDPGGFVDIGDLTQLIAFLYIPPNPVPECMDEANVDGDDNGLIDIGDLTALISYLYIPPNPPPAPCP